MSVEKEDKILFCKDCGEEFIFTIREQDFYIQKGFEHDPARCSNCRAVRKRGGPRFQQQNSYAPSSVNYYNEPGNGNGGNYQPRPNNYGNGNSGNYQPRPNNYGNGNSGNYQPRPNNYGNGNRVNNYGNGNGGNYQSRPNNYGNGGYQSRPNNYGNRPASPYGNYRPTVTSYSPGNSSNYRDYNSMQQDDRKRYPIVCMNCGIETEVPFAPREGVPVFCRTCYNMQKPNHN